MRLIYIVQPVGSIALSSGSHRADRLNNGIERVQTGPESCGGMVIMVMKAAGDCLVTVPGKSPVLYEFMTLTVLVLEATGFLVVQRYQGCAGVQ